MTVTPRQLPFPRECIFCGARPLTKEHIFPRWVHPYLPKTNEPRHESMSQLVLKTEVKTETRKKTGEPYSGALKVVCKNCNNGWMSQLQEKTKPILLPLVKGQHTTLWIKQQRSLAAWITMFTMVAEFYDRTPLHVAVPARERISLKENLLPPSNWKIWIGNYNRNKWIGMWVHATVPISGSEHIPEIGDAGLPLPNTQTTTFVVGKLYVHVFSSALIRIVKKQEINFSAMPRIWPFVATPILWPPPVTMTDTDADAIAAAFPKHASGGRAWT